MSDFNSEGRAVDNWRSPRKIEEEIRLYRRKRFEDYMQMVDSGKVDLALACAALRDEIMYADSLSEIEAA